MPTAISYSGKEKITSTLLINMSAENKMGYITEFINSDLPADEEQLARIYGAVIRRNAIDLAEVFDGNALLFTLNHDFIEGWHTVKGKLTGRISEYPKTLKDRLKMTIDHDASDCYQYYWVERDAYTGELLDSTYLYTVCDSAGGGSNSGNGGSGTGSNGNTNLSRDIHNPCIAKTVDSALKTKKNVVGIMADIIKNFDVSKSVSINVLNGHIYRKNQNGSFFLDNGGNKIPKPGQTDPHGFTNGVFNADITLSLDYFSGNDAGSKESAIAVLIHEVIHAYLAYTGDNTLNNAQHNVISEKYIEPMAKYLRSYFGMDIKDAYALAWNGISDSKAYKDEIDFAMNDGNKITKDEIDNISSQYNGGINGTKICN